jgi:hypothetical protein
MPVAQTEWTIETLDALPEDGQRYEIIDGELFVTPAPLEMHQLVVGHMYLLDQGISRRIVRRPRHHFSCGRAAW